MTEVEKKVKKVKLYTKAGDKGKTVLYDSKGYFKCDPVFEVLGDLDELSAHIGMLRSIMKFCTNIRDVSYHVKDSNGDRCDTEFEIYPKIEFLETVQSKLLDIGSAISISKKEYTAITEEDIKNIEKKIDILEERNTPLKVFIIPGVNLPDSQAHICRGVTRRAERHYIKYVIEKSGTLDDMWDIHMNNCPEILKYINRLSDYFFALARNLSNCQEDERK